MRPGASERGVPEVRLMTRPRGSVTSNSRSPRRVIRSCSGGSASSQMYLTGCPGLARRMPQQACPTRIRTGPGGIGVFPRVIRK
jgi:hypothetical protein